MVIFKKPLQLILVFALAILPLLSFANDDIHQKEVSNDAQVVHEGDESQDKSSKIKAFIQHHLQDSHDFIFFSDETEGKYWGFPLPVILIDNGLKVFSSSKFNHGETVAEVDGEFYRLYHGKIYKTDAEGTISYDEHHHPTNVKPLDFSITKNVVTMLLASFLLFVFFVGLAKSYKKGPIPTGLGRVLEPLVIFVRDDIARPNIGEKKYRKFMGYLLTVFFFILILNLLCLHSIF